MPQEETRQFLRRHFSLYPGMEMEDVIKLLYQSEFGGGHFIEDDTAFCKRLEREMAPPDDAVRPPVFVEDMGSTYSRIHLFGLPQGLTAQTFTQLCVLSAAQPQGSQAGFLQKLKTVCEMIATEELPLSAEKWNHFLEAYSEEGCPPLRHSERYRALYAPHYRILHSAWASFLPVFALVDSVLLQKARVLLAIDGMAAAGKSSLGALLQQVYGCNLLHCDDFFLQEFQRSAQRLQEAGGNIDYERLAPVMAAAGLGLELCFQPYDCQSAELLEERRLAPSPLTVLEGAYALHPQLAAPYDIRVFMMLNAAEQERRIQKRNGEVMAKRFTNEWIPMENRYFRSFAIREGCDITVDTTHWPQL